MIRLAAAVMGVAWLLLGADALATGPVDLGSAGDFGVLGGTTVTSAGVSTITGDVGVSPGTAVTGFPPGVIHGSLHGGGDVAALAHADLTTAYTDAVGRSPATPMSGVLDGLTLKPGVYGSGATISLAGTLTLDADGDPDAVFLLQAGSTLDTAALSEVELVDGARACNVFWQVGSSATLGANSVLAGTILASTSISMGDGVAIEGRALARDGAVTLINNTIAVPACGGPLSITAPAIEPFSAQLTGRTRTVHAQVGAWSVADARGSGEGYAVTVSASTPTVDGSVARAGTGASVTLTTDDAIPGDGNASSDGPQATGAQELGDLAATIATAAPGSGAGAWVFAADSGDEASLAIRLPGDMSAGEFSTTLTFTTAAPAG